MARVKTDGNFVSACVNNYLFFFTDLLRPLGQVKIFSTASDRMLIVKEK